MTGKDRHWSSFFLTVHVYCIIWKNNVSILLRMIPFMSWGLSLTYEKDWSLISAIWWLFHRTHWLQLPLFPEGHPGGVWRAPEGAEVPKASEPKAVEQAGHAQRDPRPPALTRSITSHRWRPSLSLESHWRTAKHRDIERGALTFAPGPLSYPTPHSAFQSIMDPSPKMAALWEIYKRISSVY